MARVVCFCLSVSRNQSVSQSVSVKYTRTKTKIYLPEHVFPSPFRLNPGRHRHSCPKSVFTQICSQCPNPLLLEHSSSSESPAMDKKDKLISKGELCVEHTEGTIRMGGTIEIIDLRVVISRYSGEPKDFSLS